MIVADAPRSTWLCPPRKDPRLRSRQRAQQRYATIPKMRQFCQLSGTQDNDVDGVNGEAGEHEVPVGILVWFPQWTH